MAGAVLVPPEASRSRASIPDGHIWTKANAWCAAGESGSHRSVRGLSEPWSRGQGLCGSSGLLISPVS
jgi:hypothetical protein